MKKKKVSIFKQRRFKYGSAAIIFTAVFIAAIVAFNAVFTALANNYLWYIDMTQEQVFGVSEAGSLLLKDLEANNIEYKIIFCADPDELDATYKSKLVHNCAKAFANQIDCITIEYIDVITAPHLVEKYKATAATQIKTTSVIVATETDYRLFGIDAFFQFKSSDNSLFAFQGELKFLTALIQLSGDNPIAYFTTGHGETTETSGLFSLFESAGYDVQTIDLSKDEIAENAKIIIINDPTYDFIGDNPTSDAANEIQKIDDFLDRFGHLMVFIDPSSQKLNELEDFLYEWGIEFGDEVIKDYSNSVSTDGYSLVAEYTTEGLGASVTQTIRGLETPPKTIVRYASPINLWFTERDTKETSVILKSSPTATAYDVNTGEEISTGQYNLMVISADSEYINNYEYDAYVLVAGTSYFADSSLLFSESYGNGDILFTCMKSMGKEQVPLDITFKVFEDNSLDITAAEANGWTIFMTVFPTSIALIAGAVVFFRRRHL